MKSHPKIGTMGEFHFVVGSEHIITFASDGMPAVLSTPNLIGLIERTARESLEPFLEADERTVGMEIELRHLAPTPLGAKVTITTRVIHTEGREISFQVEARDEQELIVRGVHKRAVIRVGSFARRVARKSG
ncbi:MAG: thioesterase family protein [Verrucomicrobia bacterium]|jgi:predicted thioesterase|nr:thioesterase family protein [Verrucomicrobiota bacterium]